MKTKIIAAMGTALAIALGSGAAFAGPTLNAVKQKGFVQCGVNTGLPGFSNPDSQGNWTGLDVDVCRAVAAAIFGDAKAVRFTPLSAQQRFTALQSGEIDILSRNTTWTLTRDTSLGLNFAPTTFYDGQGFMVPKALGVSSAAELNGATVCVQPGTTTELNLADYFRGKGMQFQPVVIESFDEVNAAFFSGRCDVYTTDASGMASIRSTLAPNPDDYIILPELISKEPLGPAVRHGDDEFFDIVKWTVYATVEAEEKGINSGNVDEMLKSPDPTVQRLLGSNPGMGQALGLDEKWAYNVIKTVGNYGEIFERNVGVKTPLKLERGPNALWTNGGLMYAPPIR
ncbi:amino acid ABC transporter substrate-binding protein [Skermanella sp. TT6]|uniref:Amino acid ABC transporter substrate-binding protein n=1 Tax=Skermanella cutis TaxID=2775420 RepID=A0ABX7BBU6_9PROT|nr:amino acid ABC transporter substrate-binding protein [Skermanella sp. TT6]QQP91205.1 amino acid ABC transporter substrate-binding protein [Skermanella sp. TT6]